MANSVNFPPAVGGDGSTVSDGTDPDTGLRNGGYLTRFVPALAQLVAVAQFVVTKATETMSWALTALNAATTNATSSTSLSLTDTGDISLVLNQTGKEFTVAMTVFIGRTSDPVKQMIGVIKTFNSGTGAMTVTMSSKTATAGPFTDWTIGRTSSGSIPATRAVTAAGLVTGGGTMAADMTITVTAATAAQAAAGTATNVVMTPAAQADSHKPLVLSYAATITPNFGAKRTNRVVLTGNATFAPPIGGVEGNFYAIECGQDGVGGRAGVWTQPCYDFGNDDVPDFSTGPGKNDTVYLHCLDAAAPLYRCSFKQAAA